MNETMWGVGAMIREAFEAKRRERGGRRSDYSLRTLGEESSQDHSLISKVIRGKRPATRELLVAIAPHLSPYFDLDRALIEAGLAPQDQDLVDLMRQVVAVPKDRRAALRERIGEFFTELTPEQQRHRAAARQTDTKGDQQSRNHPVAAPPETEVDD